MDRLEAVPWIIAYIAMIALAPALVVLVVSFLTGLGFFIRDMKYNLNKRRQKKEPTP